MDMFDQKISKETLCQYLRRSVTYNNAPGSASPEDDLRMILELGALFLGRAAYVWVLSPDDDEHFRNAEHFARRVHAEDARIICQAAVFEAVYPGVDQIPVPEWVFRELGQPVERRNFRFADMAGEDFHQWYRWEQLGQGGVVPDITYAETQRWFYYRCRRYIDAGYEAIHLGQPHLYCLKDRGYRTYAGLLQQIRRYASRNARRHLVLLDAHTHGISIDDHLLFDLHSRAMSARAWIEQPEKIFLQYKGGSLGGISPSGWRCEALPWVMEVDNWGGYSLPPSRWDDLAARAAAGRWGWDDISWLAHQPAETRDHFMIHAWRWLRVQDPVGFFQLPLRRLLGEAGIKREYTGMICHYQANDPSQACPKGFGQEQAVKQAWDEPEPVWLTEYHAPAQVGKRSPLGLHSAEPVVVVGSIQRVLGGVEGDSQCSYSRMRSKGRGRFELATVIPWPGSYTASISIGGTMTDVARCGGWSARPPYTIVTREENTAVRMVFEIDTRELTVTDGTGRSLLQEPDESAL